MVLIFTTSYMIYQKKLQQDTSPSNDFRVCFMTASRINYTTLAEIHPEFGEECYVCKEVPKDVLENMFTLWYLKFVYCLYIRLYTLDCLYKIFSYPVDLSYCLSR